MAGPFISFGLDVRVIREKWCSRVEGLLLGPIPHRALPIVSGCVVALRDVTRMRHEEFWVYIAGRVLSWHRGDVCCEVCAPLGPDA
jgi:hypothetical protein